MNQNNIDDVVEAKRMFFSALEEEWVSGIESTVEAYRRMKNKDDDNAHQGLRIEWAKARKEMTSSNGKILRVM